MSLTLPRFSGKQPRNIPSSGSYTGLGEIDNAENEWFVGSTVFYYSRLASKLLIYSTLSTIFAKWLSIGIELIVEFESSLNSAD